MKHAQLNNMQELMVIISLHNCFKANDDYNNNILQRCRRVNVYIHIATNISSLAYLNVLPVAGDTLHDDFVIVIPMFSFGT